MLQGWVTLLEEMVDADAGVDVDVHVHADGDPHAHDPTKRCFHPCT